MLTATYTLVALSVEQTKVRGSLHSLQKVLQSNFIDQTALTASQVTYACDAVKRLYEGCHWRKLDMFLVPAIRRATHEADQLLQDLDELARAAADAVGDLVIRLGNSAINSRASVAQFCEAIEAFCSATLKRLEREERELFPVARTVITGEAWFSIANQMLDYDAYVQDSKPARQTRMLPEPRAEQARQRSLAASLADCPH